MISGTRSNHVGPSAESIFPRVRTLLTPLSEFVTIRKLILTSIIKETTFQSVFTRFIIAGQPPAFSPARDAVEIEYISVVHERLEVV